MEIILTLSPSTKTGSTTLATYLANSLVDAKSNSLVLLIEWTKYTGRSIFLNSNTEESIKSLSTVVYDKTTLSNNLNTSKYNRNVYYLCQNMFSNPIDMNNYIDSTIINILKEVKSMGGFKYVILDLPSYTEPIKNTVLSKSFPFEINSIFSVIDEDAISFKHMKDMTELIKLTNPKIHNTTYIINKTSEYYVDYLNRYTGNDIFPAINLLKVPYIENMTDNCNRGSIYSFGDSKKFKELTSTVLMMKDIVENKTAGYGLTFKMDRLNELKEQGYPILEIKNQRKRGKRNVDNK